MDPTLSQILTALYAAHQEIDRLRARLQELENQPSSNGVSPAPQPEVLAR